MATKEVFATKHLALLRFGEARPVEHGSIVFIHGAPQSHRMWNAYLSQQKLVGQRTVYLLAFPSNDSDKPTPTVWDMIEGATYREFFTTMDFLTDQPSGQHLAVCAHDYGASYMWTYIRHRYRERRALKLDFYIDCSVGSSFRFDVFEAGPHWALMWLYSITFALVYFFPVLGGLVESLLAKVAHYPRDGKGLSARNMWWYSYQGTSVMFRIPFDLVGITYWLAAKRIVDQGGPEFLAFDFPVLFAACSSIERHAYTSAFVEHVVSTGGEFVPVPLRFGHFFPSTQPHWLIERIEAFLVKRKLAAS